MRSGSYSDSSNGRKSGSAYCITITATGTNNIIFQYDSGSISNPLIIAPDITGYDRPLTWFRGYRYAGYFQYNRMDGDNITVANLVDMQDYAKGVIPYEMSVSWPLEALKAQALCAKSYIVFNGGRHKSDGFDVCNTQHCQVYHGANSANANSDRAVDETYGMYVTYRGNVCNTVYSSSCGGATEDSENVWGTYTAYLRGVEDNFEDLNRAKNGIWQITCTNDTLTQLLTSKGYTNSGVVDFYVSKYTRMGNILEITLVDNSGKSFKFEKSAVRTFLNTNSVRFTVTTGDTALTAISSGGQKTSFKTGEKVWVVGADGNPVEVILGDDTRILSADGTTSGLPSSGTSSTGTYVVDGYGWGHNVGMCQYGALGMTERGYTFDQIIKYYFTDVEILTGDK